MLIAVAVVLVLGPGAALARARPPGLLATSGGTFVVRPPFMSFDQTQYRGGTSDYLEGPGRTKSEIRRGDQGRIRWTRWGERARGRATFFTQVCDSLDGVIQRCEPRHVTNQVGLTASRVRHHHYTRLGITFTTVRVTEWFELRSVRIKVNGAPHGLSEQVWCAVGDRSCLHP